MTRILVPLVILTAVIGCRRPAAAPPPPPVQVGVTPVTKQTVPITLEFNSTLQAIRTVQFVPRVTGYIMKRDFVEGASVERDALLYQIDPRPFQAQLEQHEAQLKADQAHATYQQSELERARAAFARDAVSENEMLQYVAQAEEAAAAVAATQAEIDATKLDLEYARITAPFAGRIQNTLINVGNLVTAEQSVLTTLVQVDPIYAVFNVSRGQLDDIQAMIHEGLVAGASGPETWKAFKARLVLPDGSVSEREGELNFVAAQIDPNTDMLMARAIFANPANADKSIDFVPGQFARLRLHLGEQPDALLVPEKAVVESQAGIHVFVVGGDNKVEMRRITLGTRHGRLRVVKGVNEGDRIIVDGTQKVRAGVTVSTQAAPAEPPAPGG